MKTWEGKKSQEAFFPTMLSAPECGIEIKMAAMDTDEQQNTPQTNLRRSNSAPLINGANLAEANISYLSLTPRHRRSSTSQMANGNPYSVPVGSPHSRLLQIRKEEFMDETEQDRMVNTSLSLSSSCESLMMNQTRRNLYSPSNCDDRRHSIDDPTNYFPSSTASSPSPTRSVTPSLPRLIPRSRSLTPSPIPSPTRQISRRSLSPVLIRQPMLNYKRKFFPDGDVNMHSPAKKAFPDPMQHSSSDETCETTNSHLNNDDDSGIETTTPTTPVTSMLFCETSHHPRVSYCRPKYTPPRSPLARSLSSNSNEETKRYSLDATNCFTFTPVQD